MTDIRHREAFKATEVIAMAVLMHWRLSVEGRTVGVWFAQQLGNLLRSAWNNSSSVVWHPILQDTVLRAHLDAISEVTILTFWQGRAKKAGRGSTPREIASDMDHSTDSFS